MLPLISETHLYEICQSIADAHSHREWSMFLQESNIQEQGGTPRWERLKLALINNQKHYNCSNGIIAFLSKALHPSHFRNQEETYNKIRENVNYHLSFYGINIHEDGNVKPIKEAHTISEAKERSNELRSELEKRNVHTDILKFCSPELLKENYFHAVLEAAKSITDKIREKSGLIEDGADLIDRAFAIKNPILVISSLRTEPEQSEHKGFANYLKGIHGMFRNVTAHAPKIKWAINKNDALDAFMVISYAHRKLDEAINISNLNNKLP